MQSSPKIKTKFINSKQQNFTLSPSLSTFYLIFILHKLNVCFKDHKLCKFFDYLKPKLLFYDVNNNNNIKRKQLYI